MATPPPVLNVATAETPPAAPQQEDKTPPNEMVTIAIAVGAVALAVIGIFALAFIAATFLTGGATLAIAPIAGGIALGCFAGSAFLVYLCYKRSKETREFDAQQSNNTPPQNPSTISVTTR